MDSNNSKVLVNVQIKKQTMNFFILSFYVKLEFCGCICVYTEYKAIKQSNLQYVVFLLTICEMIYQIGTLAF
jgi:hypothetical protein